MRQVQKVYLLHLPHYCSLSLRLDKHKIIVYYNEHGYIR